MMDLLQIAKDFGPPGLLLAFMVWDRTQQNKLTERRTEADIKMATAMTLLAERIG